MRFLFHPGHRQLWLDNIEKRHEFEELNPELLIPRTWQEKIVTYSDLGEMFIERIEQVKKKYENNHTYKNLDPTLAKAIETGKDRIIRVCEMVKRLADGKLSEQEIARFGFL